MHRKVSPALAARTRRDASAWATRLPSSWSAALDPEAKNWFSTQHLMRKSSILQNERTGTFSSLFEASKYVHQYQMKNKKPIGSPEVAAINSGLVKKQEMLKILSKENSQYSEFIYQTYKNNS